MKKKSIGGTLELFNFLDSLELPKKVRIVLPGNPVENLARLISLRILGFKVGLLVDSFYFFSSVNYQRPIFKFLYFTMRRLAVYSSNFIVFSYQGAKFVSPKPNIVLHTYSKKTLFFLDQRKPLKNFDERYYDYAFVGRFVYEKGISRFLEIVKLHPQFRFIMAGNGPLEELIISECSNLMNLSLTSFDTDSAAFDFFNNVKSVVITSLQEGCSLVSKEALAMGCNVCSVELKGNGPLELANKFHKGFQIKDNNRLPSVTNDDLNYVNQLRVCFNVNRTKLDFEKFLQQENFI